MSRLPLREAAFEAKLRGRWGRPLEVHDWIASSQDRCAELADEDAPAGALVIALGQSAGRGRRGNEWFAPPGKGLLFSLLMRPRVPAHPLAGQISLGASLALADALAPWAPDLAVKWPNDLMDGRRKLAGILPEGRLEGGRYRHLCLGVGLNLAQEPGDFPRELQGRATSLAMLAGKAPPAEEVMAALLLELEKLATKVDEGRGAEILQRWRERWPDAGRRARLGEERIRVLDIDEAGRLLIEGDGGPRALSAGDASLIWEE